MNRAFPAVMNKEDPSWSCNNKPLFMWRITRTSNTGPSGWGGVLWGGVGRMVQSETVPFLENPIFT